MPILDQYSDTPHPTPGTLLSRYWLLLGVTALAVAGFFSLILVIARTPSLAELPYFAALFHKALVVHVDLSVLVWFLSIACLMWSLVSAPSAVIIPCLEEAALLSFALGTLAMALSPIDPKGEALMSNYIPVITSPVFFLGLSLVCCGVGLMLVKLFLYVPSWERCGDSPSSVTLPHKWGGKIKFAIISSGLIAAIAIMAFIWSFKQVPRVIDGQQFYELSFWGGGHVLQFLHTQILLVCWLLIVRALKSDVTIGRWMMKIIMCIGLASALLVPLPYLLFEVTSMEHRDFFTKEMMMTGGLAPLLLALYIVPALWQTRTGKNALWTTLTMSVLLFVYGGILGEIIRGENVGVPAHYHGSIVGITLAFIGVAYLFLPMFGYKDVSNWKLAFWQPIVYGGGQMLHISGMAWSGGYGVLRKTPGGMDAVSTSVKVAMGFMGGGGVIAIIGGFMFVVVVYKSVFSKTPDTAINAGV